MKPLSRWELVTPLSPWELVTPLSSAAAPSAGRNASRA